MRSCSVCKKLRVARGTLDDYEQLAHYHYLEGRPGPVVATFAWKPVSSLPGLPHDRPVGVIVYTLPIPEMRLRTLATGDLFSGLDRRTKLAVIDKCFRRISRVIIDPRFRGLGLAVRLVRETMPKLDVPVIEALAVMGRVNPFFEKAGMKPFTAPPPAAAIEFIEALSMVGVEENEFVDAQRVQEKLDALSAPETRFVESSARRFLKGHGDRLNMSPGLERTRYILSRIAFSPVYYIWFNPKPTVAI